jgi:hypothetical protein
MGLIREANHEVNGSLATNNIEDHSGVLLEIKWWHDAKFLIIQKNLFLKILFLGFQWTVKTYNFEEIIL